MYDEEEEVWKEEEEEAGRVVCHFTFERFSPTSLLTALALSCLTSLHFNLNYGH